MPEYVELLSSYLVIRHWLDSVLQEAPDEQPLWISLRVDSTKSEDAQREVDSEMYTAQATKDFSQVPLQAYINATADINTKRPFRIRRSHAIIRGTSGNQQDIYPPADLAKANLSYSRPRLLDVRFHPRNVIFQFAVERPDVHDMWMRVRLEFISHL